MPPQPIAWFRNLISFFGEDLKIRIASKDRVPVAGILTLNHKKSMVYKYGCSNGAFNKLGGTAMLFWRAIQEAKDLGLEELDLGRSDIDNLGLIAFKEHWSAEGLPLTYWTYPEVASRFPGVWKKTFLRYMVSSTPDRALRAIGELLYKHVG
jgi:hypothetical protein